MGPWAVKRDVDRAQWAFSPFVSVGPLRFGMSPVEVGAALDGAKAYVSHGMRDGALLGSGAGGRAQRFTEVGVTAFYTESVRLAGVSVDALKGPQVRLGEAALVGCVPSEIERWLSDHARAHGLELAYTHEANPKVVDLGLVMRVQRAGDVVLSRPLFLIREWAVDIWESLPGFELSTF
jgi:hypothetical protein